MRSSCSKKELETIAKKLGFTNTLWFASFLANDYDLFNSRQDGIEDNKEYFLAEQEFLTTKLDEIRKTITPKKAESTIEMQILQVIAMVKQFNIDYLLNKFPENLDYKTAEQLVEYGYTHGCCNSLAYTLSVLFKGCKPKIFCCGQYAHQCVELNGKVFDIAGCSTIDEMKGFVAKEGNDSIENCSIADIEVYDYKQKLLDFILTQYINQVRECLHKTQDAESF